MRIKRAIVVMSIVVWALAGFGLAARLFGDEIVEASPLLTPTLMPSPNPTPTGTPVFSATLSVVPDQTLLRVGDIVTLDVNVAVSQGCQYPILELSLYQAKDETPIFDHIDPPADLIKGPISLPSTWTFRATQTGLATFKAQTFGERYCNDFWNWHYLYDQSEPIFVYQAALWLPLVSR